MSLAHFTTAVSAVAVHRRMPHVQAGVIYGVRPDRLLVSVPEYHIRGKTQDTGPPT